jgi:amino acid transporter
MAIVWVAQGKPSGMEVGTGELVPHIRSGNIAFISGALLMFMGIELSAIHAGDVRNPQRTIPRANAIAVSLCVVLFLPLTLALAAVIPSGKLNIVAGLVEAGRIFFEQYGVPWLDSVLALMLVFGLGIALIQILGGPSRGLMIAGRQGNLPPSLQRENAVGMPTRIIMVQAAISSLLGLCYIFLGSIQNTWFMFLAIQTCVSLVVYLLMFSSVIKLRRLKPNASRPYKIPGGKVGLWLVCGVGFVVALVGIAISLFPTDEATNMSDKFYIAFLTAGVVGFLSIPFIVRLFRRPTWVSDKPIVDEDVDTEGDAGA